ncbi:MAG: hypothetical protein ACYTFM_06725 [Planctomycetota bacterium]|jgi:hypothetical protein
MNRAQKISWFNLKAAAVGICFCLLMVAISSAANQVAISIIGFLFLSITACTMALSHHFFKKEEGQVNFDERDAIIEKKAHFIGYCTLWCIFIAVCTIPVFAVSSIPTIALPVVLAVTLLSVKIVESIAVLVQYGWGSKGEKS